MYTRQELSVEWMSFLRLTTTVKKTYMKFLAYCGQMLSLEKELLFFV